MNHFCSEYERTWEQLVGNLKDEAFCGPFCRIEARRLQKKETVTQLSCIFLRKSAGNSSYLLETERRLIMVT